MIKVLWNFGTEYLRNGCEGIDIFSKIAGLEDRNSFTNVFSTILDINYLKPIL